MSFKIVLPGSVSEESLIRFVQEIAKGNLHSEIQLDFQRVSWMTPGGVAALVAICRGWVDAGKAVRIIHHLRCPASRYLQRFDLFNSLGIKLQETFQRHQPGNRFVPVCKIARDGTRRIEELYTALAGVLAPEEELGDDWESGEGGAYSFFEHSISELGNNVIQHARAPGYVCAQYYPTQDVVRLAIADSGLGIRESFRVSESPLWGDGLTDLEAMKIALAPHKSSKLHQRSAWGGEPVNAGVGLTVLDGLAKETGGKLLVISGRATYTSWSGFGELSGALVYKGTVCALVVPRAEAMNFNRHMRAVNARIAPISDQPNTFEGVFR